MENYCDLHVHSHYSDGTCSPAQLLQLAEQAGLKAIALCDHNTLDGIGDFLAAAKNTTVEAIAGIEISTDHQGTELHILGLFLKPEQEAPIRALMDRQKVLKEESNVALVKALNKAGYAIDYAAIKASTPKGNVNRALVAAELTRMGYTESVQDAFKKLLSPKHGYYVPPKHPDAYETIGSLKNMGVTVVLAHPFLSLDEAGLRKFLPKAVELGLDGMEVMYSKYDAGTTALAMSIAWEYGLLPSGGSDFHGENKPDIQIGTGRGNLQIPLCYLQDLRS